MNGRTGREGFVITGENPRAGFEGRGRGELMGESYLEFATRLAREAGDHALQFFSTGVVVERKADNTPVTEADRSTERLMVDAIRSTHWTHSILGEEGGAVAGDPDYQWVIDPIDGTKSFVHGVPLFTTLIALVERGTPTVGVIYAPALNEIVFAEVGKGCFFNGKRCGVSGTDQLDEALVCCSDITMAIDRSPAFMSLARQCRYGRTWGDGYGYMLVATGRAEIMVDPAMNPWDIAALIPVITEAGGHCSSWDGKSSLGASDFYATNAALQHQVADVLRHG